MTEISRMTKVDQLPDVLTVLEVAQFLGVSSKTVYELINRGELVASRVGRIIRITKASLLRFLKANVGVSQAS